jgi:hypothetical protein
MPLPTTPTGAPQQPAPPNPQNGPNNPYYNPFTYTYGAAVGGVPAAPTVIGVPSTKAPFTLTHTSPRQLLRMTTSPQGDLIVSFTGEENGQYLNLEFAPERNITTFEQIQFNLLLIGAIHQVVTTCQHVMQYVRAHQLERHFKITVTA